jgi:hypothetical protein
MLLYNIDLHFLSTLLYLLAIFISRIALGALPFIMRFWNNRRNFDRDEKTKKSRHARFRIPLPWSKQKETGTTFESQPIHSTQIYDWSINEEQIRRLESMAPLVATRNAPITTSEPTVDGHSREEEKAREVQRQ